MQEATEGDVRLRRGPRIKEDKLGFVLRIALGVSMFWNVEGGGGGCLFPQRMNTHTPMSTVAFFSLISNDIFREGVVCWKKNLVFTYF